MIEDRIHAWFDERVVEPRFQQIVLPSLWPRKKTARGPGDEVDDENDIAVDDSGEESEETRSNDVAANGRSRAKFSDNGEVSLESRMELEGQRLREADRAERNRSKERATGASASASRDGMRWRGEAMRMPGALPA